MIFKRIILHNIFSYYDTRTFDLTPPADNRGNIVVIMGRNGFGKTSLLNSVKLLFGGVTKELRKSVQRDRLPHEKSFVLGDRDWWGILNRRAKNKGDFKCSVSIVLLDENNREIEVERAWNLDNDNYQDQLTVKAPHYPPLTKEAAQHYLFGLLPLSYIPFFFFDAEEIGYLAEANRNEVIEKMEQLLNIRSAENVKECLVELTKKIARESIAKNAKERLADAENRQKTLFIQREELENENKRIQFDIETLEDELREIRRKLQLLSGQGAIENNAKFDGTRKAEFKNLEDALTGLSEAFERDAFLRVNSKLVQKSLSAIERCANNQQGATAEMLQSLKGPLKDIFTTPPYPEHRLSDSQVAFYQKRITKLLDSRDIDEEEKKPFRLDASRAKKLLASLSAYAPLHIPDATLRSDLSRALRADDVISHIDKILQEAHQLSDENKQQLEHLNEQQLRQQDEVLNCKDKLRDVTHKLSIIDRDLKPLEEEIAKLRKQARESDQGRLRIDLLEKMQKLLAAYKKQLKERQRGALETFFNQHLNNLLDSNHLIAETKIDDFFQMHYLDASGTPVAMSSISAGMKQLAATALLWALKDACGRQLPVIIDTPLGRIDKQHQHNLLTRYYPHAAKQVILLPTDSELDERKRSVLASYIYREFHLHNPDGENTEIELITPFEETQYG